MERKTRNTKIVTINDLLMLPLSKFYHDKKHIDAILPIIDDNDSPEPTRQIAGSKSKRISLRLIDWFITNYSKKNNTVITRNDAQGNVIHFNVYLSYRSQLKAYSKKLFDPFRRRDRIMFFYDKKKSIETTIGQLNIFRWILENKIIDYIKDHFDQIDRDMVTTQKKNQMRKLQEDNIKTKAIDTPNGTILQKRKKRNTLSKSSSKNINLINGIRTIKFD